MRISDWSSDVCSSDLLDRRPRLFGHPKSAAHVLETLLSPKAPAARGRAAADQPVQHQRGRTVSGKRAGDQPGLIISAPPEPPPGARNGNTEAAGPIQPLAIGIT